MSAGARRSKFTAKHKAEYFLETKGNTLFSFRASVRITSITSLTEANEELVKPGVGHLVHSYRSG